MCICPHLFCKLEEVGAVDACRDFRVHFGQLGVEIKLRVLPLIHFDAHHNHVTNAILCNENGFSGSAAKLADLV